MSRYQADANALDSRQRRRSASAFVDRTGHRYGRWTVLGYDFTARPLRMLVRCDCGTEAARKPQGIYTGASKSCGCLNRELCIARSTKHGHAVVGAESTEHVAWAAMRERCHNPRAENYRWYGAKGVKVCERWDSFAAFLADMGTKPTPRHTLDRVDPFGNYEPSNCRWATWDEQMRNQRRHHVPG